NMHVVEKYLVEFGVAVDLPQWTDSNPRRPHINDKAGNPFVLRRTGVCPRQEQAKPGVLGVRGPHLLTVDDEIVPLLNCSGLQRRDVRPSVGLRVTLTPDFFGIENSRNVALLL